MLVTSIIGYLRPRVIILLGFVLVLTGAILPFLMVLDIIQPSFLLCFLAFGASVGGLLLGMVGIAYRAEELMQAPLPKPKS